jgi:DNA-binding Lrp family transcriptional regulator
MILDKRDRQLLALLAQGLPLCPRPYAQLGDSLALSESEVLERIARLQQAGLIKRLGVIVKHARLGYKANAMIVWQVPESAITALGEKISQFSFVTLCYQRPAYPQWNYNLYCMIHGKDRETVLSQLAQLNSECALQHLPQQILFSRRCFKQRGAVYGGVIEPVMFK